MGKGEIEFRGDIHLQFSYFKAYHFEFQCRVWDGFLVQILFYFWPNFKLHPLSLVKVQFSTLSFDCFNLVL